MELSVRLKVVKVNVKVYERRNKCTKCGASNCENNGTCIKCEAVLVTIDDLLKKDLEIYGNAYEAIIDGKRVRIHPDNIKVWTK